MTYLRFELLRALRNRRFFVFTLGFPLVLYFLLAGPQHNEKNFSGSHISAPLYYMVGLVAFGTMSALLSTGARIGAERSVGWNRQLRITPLSTGSYFRAKILTGYMMAALAIVLLYVAGSILGVRLSAGRWLAMTGLIIVGLIPFAAMAIALGHLVSGDSAGPAVGGSLSLFAFLGGTWFPIPDHGALHVIGYGLPSFWIVRASHIALGGGAWSSGGWIVIAAWTIAATVAARVLYRRDTGRV